MSKKKKTTEIVAILDRSGSMQNLMNDLIGGFDSLIKEQKETGEPRKVTVASFDNEYELLYDGVDIEDVESLQDKIYARGSTALLDAVGKTINTIKNRISNMKPKDQPEKVMVLVTTDGYENSSCEFKLSDIKKEIKKLEEEMGWEFIFTGANIDAFGEGGNMGFAQHRTTNFANNGKGVRAMMCAYSSAVSCSSKGESYDMQDLYDENSK
jgi:uncharacterized protein YegL